MIEQFVTPSKSQLREKPFSRNAEQVHSPLISLLLGGCRGICSYVFDIEAHIQYVCVDVVRIWAYKFTDMGVLLFCYGHANLHAHTGIVRLLFIKYTIYAYSFNQWTLIAHATYCLLMCLSSITIFIPAVQHTHTHTHTRAIHILALLLFTIHGTCGSH